MKITLKKSCIISPLTRISMGIMKLSELDQVGVLSHIPTIYFYRPEESWVSNGNDIFTVLTTSLSKTLDYFYPLAGRLRSIGGGRLEIDCNGDGVFFTEAECDDDMDVLGDFSPSSEFHHLVPHVDYSVDVEEIPLVLVQLTKFRCGGVSLGLCNSHAVADGLSAAYFTNEWARITRGEEIVETIFLDRRLLRAGEPPAEKLSSKEVQYKSPPLIVGEINSEIERKKKTSTVMLKLTKRQVDILKTTANKTPPSRKPYSRYEALAAHIWRCTSLARRHVHDQPTGFAICVDIRSRMNLPRTFFGNATVDVFAQSFSGELTMKPLSFAAGKIREAINTVTSEYVNSYIDFLKNFDDLSPLQDIDALRSGEGPFYGNPNIAVVSWLNLPLYGLDFGWGKEISMGPGAFDCDGDSLLIPDISCEGKDGGVVVGICLQDEYVEEFKRAFFKDIQNYS